MNGYIFLTNLPGIQIPKGSENKERKKTKSRTLRQIQANIRGQPMEHCVKEQ